MLEVMDLASTVEFLLDAVAAGPPRLRNPNPRRVWLREQLARLPAVFPHEPLALKIPGFREAMRNGWFRFDAIERDR